MVSIFGLHRFAVIVPLRVPYCKQSLAADSALSETTALRKLVTLGFLKLLDNFIGITVGFYDFWVVDNGFSFHDSW
jgi:hypothetical protein